MSEHKYCPWCNGPGILLSRDRRIGFILWPHFVCEFRVVCGGGECCYQPEGQWQSSRESAWSAWNFRPKSPELEINKNGEPTYRSIVAQLLGKSDAQLLAERAAMSPFGAFQCRHCGNIFPKASEDHGAGDICALCSTLRSGKGMPSPINFTS